jgi:2,3-bisphosphoglycerate-dependent phosphoglycerate mutase
MYKIVLIRHGQSIWNKEKKFCGWTDVDLSEQGLVEAHNAGKALLREGFVFDIAYTSLLKRAIQTLEILLGEMGQTTVPVNYSWRLNERHYGALQGLKHEDVAKQYSDEQVQIWRRSFKTRPPQLSTDDSRYPGNDPKYKDLSVEDLPTGESLEDTIKRVMPYWNNEIVPMIQSGKKVIISASGNSLRALIKHIDGISDEDIMKLEIQTGTPLVYELEEDTLKPIKHYYLN